MYKIKLGKYLFFMLAIFTSIDSVQAQNSRFIYEIPGLKLTATSITDSLRTVVLADLPEAKHTNQTQLRNATPITLKLWDMALHDVETNIVSTDKREKYFGAGRVFGMTVYERDISFSGLLALNKLYPKIMLSSLKYTRDLRLKLGLQVSKGLAVNEIKGNWIEDKAMTQKDFVQKYHTHPYTRRTDDVVWIWAAYDLFENNPAIADWPWLYATAKACFQELYNPFFDSSDGLYRGQAAFIDIHEIDHQTTGYPQNFTQSDCVLVKALSTNSLYYQALKNMASVCKKIGKEEEGIQWLKKAENLRHAILKNLRFKDGSFTYFKDKNGILQPRREALGTALAVITGVVKGKDAQKCLANYPFSWAGVPLFYPFYTDNNGVYHNNTSWPFVDTFFMWAKEIADGKDYTSQNAAMMARITKGESFREIVNWKTKEPSRSKNQLWSAAAFMNTCLRAGLVEQVKE